MIFRAVIFDFDGTIVDSEPLHREAWNVTLGSWGVCFSESEYIPFVGISDGTFVEYLIRERKVSSDYPNLMKSKEKIFNGLMRKAKLIDGVEDLVRSLNGSTKKAIASSAKSSDIIPVLERKGLRDEFAAVIGAESVTNKKPNPEVYLKACLALDCTPSSCLAIEDSSAGVRSAKSAGLTVVAVPNKFTRHHDFSESDIIANGFYDPRLLALLDGSVPK